MFKVSNKGTRTMSANAFGKLRFDRKKIGMIIDLLG